jgi:assimilatory nitrate reductase catalytic subunit
MTNLEGRVLRRRRVLPPPDGVKTDIEVLCALGERLGHGERFRFTTSEQVFDELRRASAGGPADYSGISYERIDAGPGVFWPCPEEGHSGTPRLFGQQFPTPSGRARFHPVQHLGPAESPDGDYPLVLTTGRVLAQYQSGTQTRRVSALVQAAPEPRAQLHPCVARQYGLEGGALVTLVTPRGRAQFRVEVTPHIREDTIFVPFHWGGAQAINRLTNAALDPICRMPEFKVCAVRIEPPHTNPGGME